MSDVAKYLTQNLFLFVQVQQLYDENQKMIGVFQHDLESGDWWSTEIILREENLQLTGIRLGMLQATSFDIEISTVKTLIFYSSSN